MQSANLIFGHALCAFLFFFPVSQRRVGSFFSITRVVPRVVSRYVMRLKLAVPPVRVITAPRMKLEYLPFRAMAETTRFMLRYGKIPYRDHVVWGQTFAARRSAGHYAFDKVPVMHVAERPAIPQSGTMARFAAKLAGCYPSGELEHCHEYSSA